MIPSPGLQLYKDKGDQWLVTQREKERSSGCDNMEAVGRVPPPKTSQGLVTVLVQDQTTILLSLWGGHKTNQRAFYVSLPHNWLSLLLGITGSCDLGHQPQLPPREKPCSIFTEGLDTVIEETVGPTKKDEMRTNE